MVGEHDKAYGKNPCKNIQQYSIWLRFACQNALIRNPTRRYDADHKYHDIYKKYISSKQKRISIEQNRNQHCTC